MTFLQKGNIVTSCVLMGAVAICVSVRSGTSHVALGAVMNIDPQNSTGTLASRTISASLI